MTNTSAVLQHLGVLDFWVDFAAEFTAAEDRLIRRGLTRFGFDTTYRDFTSHVSSLADLPASAFPQRDRARQALQEIRRILGQLTRVPSRESVEYLTECVGNLIKALPNPTPRAQQVYTSTIETQSTPALSNTIDQERPEPSQPSLPHYFSNPPRSNTADSIAADEPSSHQRPSRVSTQDAPAGHRVGKVTTWGRAKVLGGNIYTDEGMRIIRSGNFAPFQSSHVLGDLNAGEDSQIVIGDQFGGPGFFDRSNSAPPVPDVSSEPEHEPKVNRPKKRFTGLKMFPRN
ncbi:hypothetical protein LTR05_006157 [Lithohypha guttulata]|uniref:Uncharacterized protein n=1 Tax=Lithohypha guttulata TaxID=1690604 RepID=A0AAN7Y5I5_9EURO|nr:hypothetical protein LTR05_006157 [Lithohypha guttulata]